MLGSLPAWLSAWSWDPALLVDLALGGALYFLGWRRLGQRAGGRARPARWRAGCFAAGLGVLVVALFSPLDTFDGRYFVVHMLQHLLLAWVAPPLLWLGAPLVPLVWSLPAKARRPIGRWLRPGRPLARLGNWLVTPLVALIVFLVVVAGWHVPALYNLAEGPTLAHDLEHLTFFGAGLLYWWPIVQPTPARRRLAPLGGGIFYLLVPGVEGGLLGGFFTFSDRVVYAYYLHPTPPGGLSPLADQHLAGIAMWLFGGLIAAAAAFALIGSFLIQEERAVAQHPPQVDNQAIPGVVKDVRTIVRARAGSTR